MRAMSLIRKLTIGGAAAAGFAFMLGFLMFASLATRGGADDTETADGIVVLTGGEKRIAEASRLLADGKARRLLISGVNRMTTKKDVRRLTSISGRLFACCVDLGYAALNTRGNAEETRDWARTHEFSSLIVVTASYHMPRSLAELSQVLPNVRLVAHPVVPSQFADDPWWLSPTNARILAGEYVKFLPTAARLAIGRLMRSPAEGGEAPKHADKNS